MKLRKLMSMLLCVLMSTPMAIFFGWLLGKLFNKTKGAEMIAGLVLGFFAAGLYRLFTLYIIGGVIPFDDPNLLDRGFGLRNAFDLTGNLKYAVDDISFLTTASVLSVVFPISAVVLFLHDKKMGIDSKKQFTTKEFDLLTFLAEHPNHVFTKDELFREIWDMESIGDIATVTVHIKKIREKVEMNTNKPQYIETIWGVGYRFKL